MNRRDFLKKTSAVAAVAVVAPMGLVTANTMLEEGAKAFLEGAIMGAAPLGGPYYKNMMTVTCHHAEMSGTAMFETTKFFIDKSGI